MFPVRNDLKQEDVLTLLLFNFVLEYEIMNVMANQYGWKVNGTHKLLVSGHVSKSGCRTTSKYIDCE
jgi:hypothetical protein